jgi:antagonist of KipI
MCALEITLMGPTLVADCDLACVLYGAPFELSSDRQQLNACTTFTLHAAEELRIGPTRARMRAYFCVGGGLQSPLVLGSRSGFGPVKAGTELPCLGGSIRPRFLPAEFEWNREPRTLRVIAGVQANWFQSDQFYAQDFIVLPLSNRMGLRLHGNPMSLPSRELTSEPVCPGSVQVTPDGQCIVLGVDGQTIGGYPKIAQVIQADVDKLGQLRPNDRIRFVPVDLVEAERLFQKKQGELIEWLTRLRTAELLGP